MTAPRPKPPMIEAPLDLIVEAARRLAENNENYIAERLLRAAYARAPKDPAVRRWLVYTLEARGCFREAYEIHVQKRLSAGMEEED